MPNEIARSALLAAAYVDPNTGGTLFELLAVVFAILSGILVVFSKRIRMGLAQFSRRLRERAQR